MRPIAVIGSLARDLIDGRPPRTGGAAFHAARALRLLAVPSRVVTKSREEDRRALLPALLRLGVPVSWHPASATATFGLDYEGESRRVTIKEVGEPWSAEEARGWVASALGRTEWVHVGPLARSDFPPETLAVLARRRKLSLDGQGLVRPGRSGPVVLDSEFDPALLRHVTVLKLAEEEAKIVLPAVDEESIAALGVPEVLVTLGSRGSIVFAGGRAERVTAYPVKTDPTGAGDAFAAGYLAARSLGRPPVAAARSASRLVEALLLGGVR